MIPAASGFGRKMTLFPRVLTRGLLLGILLTPFWPAGCATPRKSGAQVATTPSTIEAPAGAPTGGAQLPFLPHPAFAFADPAARVSIADIAERVTKSVVSVAAERESQPGPPGIPFPFFGPEGPNRQRGLGSGVIVSADVVLTNNHVVEGADVIRVSTPDGREFTAELVGADERSDLAVLKLQGNVLGLTPIPFGQSERLRLGDIVLAIGNPFGVGQTVTMGIVSAKGRADVGIADYEDFIQTDAAINPGNSGGALVDMEGNLVGINTAILSRSGGYQGIGFAIPTEMARPIMDSLLQTGKVVRGYLGVGIQDVDPALQEALGMGDRDGVLISSVEPGGAAERAGVQRGDVVLSVDGSPVGTTGRLRNLIAAKGKGRVQLEILRGGKPITLGVELGQLPDKQAQKLPGAAKDSGALGLELSQLSPEIAKRFGLDRSEGVVVIQVVPGSPAANAGLQSGDVLLEVDRVKVTTPADVQRAARAKPKGSVLLLVEREGRTRYVAVKR
jgi:serine protease Do